jgi:hypothetical protein
MKRFGVGLLVVLFAVLPQWSLAVSAAPAQQTADCLFVTEAAGPTGGFPVCDDASGRFKTAYQRWGLQRIGYPVSQRYMRDGFVTQAFQKAIMQWRPESQSIALVNIFDDLHNAGFDEVLFRTRQTPNQLPAGWDGNLTFPEVVKKRQALLDARPAMRTTYFAVSEPLTFYGLPTSEISDMGNHYAIRLQRAVLQEWKEDVPWAKAGQVTIANGGDIAKELKSLPEQALAPSAEPPTGAPPLIQAGSAPQPTAPAAPTAAATAQATTTAAPQTSPTVAATAAPQATATPAATSATGRILVTSNRVSYDDCYTMNPDGSDVKRLTTFGFCYDAHFSPDGKQIVFSHQEREGVLPDVWIMTADGSGQTNLTKTQDNIESYPVISPDGQKIAYLFGWPGGFEIYTMNLDGTDRKPITSRNLDLMPSWSSDNQTIAFASARGGSFNIWVVNRDGTGLRQVTQFGRERAAISPVFSPDGKQIAFSTIAQDTGFEIWTVNLDGSNAHKVVSTIGNDRNNDTFIAAWRNGKFLFGGYQGHWDPYFVPDAGGDLVRVNAGDKDDTPSDWWIP